MVCGRGWVEDNDSGPSLHRAKPQPPNSEVYILSYFPKHHSQFATLLNPFLTSECMTMATAPEIVCRFGKKVQDHS